ncbi:hypothetical protein [Legionella sp. CNM-4043-24]|uniref:hypothetical protein n=1 Tax=Legionella sp. CNM-4043-24 TaxID=3421646 RepID=UPI00403A806F
MTRTAFHLFSEREKMALSKEQAVFELHRTAYESLASRMQASEEVVEEAMKRISQSALDDEIKQTIERTVLALENAIGEESVYMPMVAKYEALAAMLRQVVIENNSLETRAAAMEAYLAAFRRPSSRVEERVKLGLGIAGLALIVGIFIALSFVLPLIPFTALFTLMGLSAAMAGIATTAAVVAGKLTGVWLSVYCINKFIELIFNPLANLVQKLSDEHKNAQVLQQCLQPAFFRAATPALITEAAPSARTQLTDNDDDDEEQEAPLLAVN